MSTFKIEEMLNEVVYDLIPTNKEVQVVVKGIAWESYPDNHIIISIEDYEPIVLSFNCSKLELQKEMFKKALVSIARAIDYPETRITLQGMSDWVKAQKKPLKIRVVRRVTSKEYYDVSGKIQNVCHFSNYQLLPKAGR